MRSRLWLLAVSVVASVSIVIGAGACDRAPLTRDAEPIPVPHDGGAEAGSVPAAVLDWAIPVGTAAPSGGATTLAAVVPLDDGGAVVAGTFTGTIGFAGDTTLAAAGTSRVGYVARYRTDQRLVWAKAIAADGDVVVADMVSLGDDEVAIAGWFEGTMPAQSNGTVPALPNAGGLDLFAARIAADGSVRWRFSAGGSGDDIARAISAHAGASGELSIAVTGAVGGDAAFHPGQMSPPRSGPIFAARFDGGGALDWVRFAGDGVPGQGYGVAVDDAGAVAVTGYVNGPAPFGRDPFGTTVTIDPVVGRAFVARWDSDGDLQWAQPLGGPSGEGDVIAAGRDGALFAGGLFGGQARFGAGDSAPTLIADAAGELGAYLVALERDGKTRWARRLTGIGIRPWHLRVGRNGDLLVAASFGGGIVADPDGARPLRVFSSGNTDALFMRFGGDGVLGSVTAGGGLGADIGVDFVAAFNGTLWAGGNFFGPAAFGAGSAFGAGASATLDSGTPGGAFLLRLEP